LHQLVYRAGTRGEPVWEPLRLVGDVLVWNHSEDRLVRVETAQGLDAARRIAESVP
jgi:hypothetical protein